MLRKVLFQIHWFLGLTIGAVVTFSGLTGATMAFGPELTDFCNGANEPVVEQSTGPLNPATLYARIHAARPLRTISKLTFYDDPRKLVRVVFAPDPGSVGPLGPKQETRFADPFNGELRPVHAMGRRIEWLMLWLRDVHQGHWSGPGRISGAAATAVGLGAVVLMFMAASGLYLRWPRGKAARTWRAWLKIYPVLRGRAFLFNLHAVMGTCALLALLVIAHSGAWQNGEMRWYGDSVRYLAGLPPHPEGPPPTRAQATPPVTLVYMSRAGFINADTMEVGAVRAARLYPETGRIEPVNAAAAPRNFGAWLDANNQNIHEGRILGRAGVLVMLLSALCLPGFYITGWMMYLKRSRRGRDRT